MKFLLVTACLFAVATARGFPPSITIPQGNRWSQQTVYIRKGNAQTFECHANAEPKAKYSWVYNGEKINNKDPGKMSVDQNTGTLTIGKRFNEDQSGDYQCYAKNGHGTSMTPILKIKATVTSAFGGTEGASDLVSVFVSKYVKLTCENIPRSVPPWDLSWERGIMTEGNLDSAPVVPNKRMVVDQQGSLHILWAEKNDHDYIYSCLATNRVMLVTVRNTMTIKLNVKNGQTDDRAPELKSNQHQNVVVNAGETAKLMCVFTYYSDAGERLSISWLFKGVEVGQGPELVIENVPDSESQEGEYMCKGTLGDKEAIGYVHLKIVSPPSFLDGQEPESKSVPVEKDAVFNCDTASRHSYTQPPVWLVNAEPLLGCPPRHFECKTKKINGFSNCKHEKLRCNTFPDCDDGSDEEGCAVLCPESQKQCGSTCIPQSSPCSELVCDHPGFMCRDKKSCLGPEKICDGVNDCADKSDERACKGGEVIERNRFKISSDRTQLTLPSVGSGDSMCFQCMVTNDYGTTIGDGCLAVIDKILVLRAPNSTYDVEPGTLLDITVEATTDQLWQNQMKFYWMWYQQVEDEKTGAITTVAETLPPKGEFGNYFKVSLKGTNMVMQFPEVGDADTTAYNVYNSLKDRQYTVVIEHRYDRVELNFTITGVEIVKPTGVPVVEQASTNLWFIALILAILILFIVVSLIVCYMYRNRGGVYALDKKEHQAGHDPAQELKDSGFQDVGRVDDDYDDGKPHGEEASLSESVKPYESDDDPTEEYGGDFDVSKFNEDGSFIGLYGDKKSKYAKEATV